MELANSKLVFDHSTQSTFHSCNCSVEKVCALIFKIELIEDEVMNLNKAAERV